MMHTFPNFAIYLDGTNVIAVFRGNQGIDGMANKQIILLGYISFVVSSLLFHANTYTFPFSLLHNVSICFGIRFYYQVL